MNFIFLKYKSTGTEKLNATWSACTTQIIQNEVLTHSFSTSF